MEVWKVVIGGCSVTDGVLRGELRKSLKESGARFLSITRIKNRVVRDL